MAFPGFEGSSLVTFGVRFATVDPSQDAQGALEIAISES